MKHFLLPLVLGLSLCSTSLMAQDMHWTLFEFSPTSINPASTGNFYGTYRLSGLFRDGSFNIKNSIGGSTNTYKSVGASIDGPLALGFRKQDWIGVGGMFYGDRSGSLGLGLTYSMLSVAYHFSLDKQQTRIFSIGLQGGGGSRALKDFNEARFEDGTMNGFMTNNMGEIDKKGFFDLNFGLGYRAQVNKQTALNIGLTVNQLSFAEQALLPQNNTQTKRDSGLTTRPLGIGLNGAFDFALNKKWDLHPAFRVQTMGPALEMQLQGWLGYLLNEEEGTKLRFGLGYRIGDAAQVLLGLDIKDITVGLGYDISLSDVTAVDQSFGGIELGVTYIGKIFKEPKIKPVILCPRY
ncbi:MAG: PorP/SprF family type IX secretion system membrane protein [Saprospiraceae bacterium]|nr:PorP/SprF family type IX secretion system membrane protein [Saprospiraceae bacterium]